jgi:hypothetical protein
VVVRDARAGGVAMEVSRGMGEGVRLGTERFRRTARTQCRRILVVIFFIAGVTIDGLDDVAQRRRGEARN